MILKICRGRDINWSKSIIWYLNNSQVLLSFNGFSRYSLSFYVKNIVSTHNLRSPDVQNHTTQE
jgi:hypothetical protein